MNQDTSLLDSIIADIENVQSQDPKTESVKQGNSLMDDIESIKDLIDIYPSTNLLSAKGKEKWKQAFRACYFHQTRFFTHVHLAFFLDLDAPTCSDKKSFVYRL